MVNSNKHYKQILIDSDNYNALKALGQGVDFGYLRVVVHVIDNFCDWMQASDFSIHISGNH